MRGCRRVWVGNDVQGVAGGSPSAIRRPCLSSSRALSQALAAPLELSGGFRELHPSAPLPTGFLFPSDGKFPRSGFHLPAPRRSVFSVVPTPSQSWNPQVSHVEKGRVGRRGGGRRFGEHFRSVCLLIMAWGLLRRQKLGGSPACPQGLGRKQHRVAPQ